MKPIRTLPLFLCFIILITSAVPTTVDALTQQIPKTAGAPAALGFEQIISGLSSPVGIAHAGDGSDRLFIIQRSGQVLIYNGSQVLATPFLDISSNVTAGNETGLLGIAFHPNYENNGYFFVNYTRTVSSQLQTIVARYQVSSNANIADSTSASIIMTIDQDASNHNGGQIQFGPDGYLYIGMGDGGGGGDPLNRAQNPSTLLGKMLRIDVDGGTPYAIPPSNPFISNANIADEIWAFGLRNPWRFSFDSQTGDLFIADVGQNAWEEVNIQPATSTGGENYGWSCKEGDHDYDTGRNCTTYGTLTDPILEYEHGSNDSVGCSITGGYVYRGEEHPILNGIYLYGDFCTGKIWAARQNASIWTSTLVADTNFLITTFGEDESGELYLANISGNIYRISASSFADVPTSHPYYEDIEILYANGLTAGCAINPLRFCPETIMNRAESAVFMLRGNFGNTYAPPTAPWDTFQDNWSQGAWAEKWAEGMYAQGLTAGCALNPLRFCPWDQTNREQAAVFGLKLMYGNAYSPPAATGNVFADMTDPNYWATRWTEQAHADGLLPSCGIGAGGKPNFCPTNLVSRGLAASIIVRAKSLTMP